MCRCGRWGSTIARRRTSSVHQMTSARPTPTNTAQCLLMCFSGATRGLGRAMAERLIEAGHTVLGCGRGHAEIARLSRMFKKPHDFSAIDVSRDEQVRDWATRLLAEHGPPDLLLNNAALVNHN